MQSKSGIIIGSLAIIGGSSYAVTQQAKKLDVSKDMKFALAMGASTLIAGTVLSTQVRKVQQHGLIPAILYRAGEIGSHLTGGYYCSP